MNTDKAKNRENVAPVSDYTDKNGWVIPAGTVGTLTYTGGSRGWSFYTGASSWSIKASDLFRFVNANELPSAALGHDVAAGEKASTQNKLRSERSLRSVEVANSWGGKTRGYNLTDMEEVRHAEWVGTGHFKGTAGQAIVTGRMTAVTAYPFIVFFATSTGEGTHCVKTYDEGLELAAALAEEGISALNNATR